MAFNHFKNQRGENLIELMVVLTVAILVIGSLVFSTISSLRNSQFSKNQIQATKYAQAGIEQVRSMRDRDGGISNFPATGSPQVIYSITSWSDPDLWSDDIKEFGACNPCYFVISSNQQDIESKGDPNDSTIEDIGGEGKFFRYLILDDDEDNYEKEKKVTVVVKWNDVSGSHESRLTTILRKL